AHAVEDHVGAGDDRGDALRVGRVEARVAGADGLAEGLCAVGVEVGDQQVVDPVERGGALGDAARDRAAAEYGDLHVDLRERACVRSRRIAGDGAGLRTETGTGGRHRPHTATVGIAPGGKPTARPPRGIV